MAAYIAQQAGSTTTTSFSVTVGGLATPYNYQRKCYWYARARDWGEVYVGETFIDPNAVWGGTKEFVGLWSNETYAIRCSIYNNVTGVFQVDLYCDATTLSKTRPANWDWGFDVEYSCKNNGRVADITYTLWNSFVDKVNEFRNYKSAGGLLTSAVKMISTEGWWSVTKFNVVKNSIGELSATGIVNKVPGDLILGWDFITLKTSVNTIY